MTYGAVVARNCHEISLHRPANRELLQTNNVPQSQQLLPPSKKTDERWDGAATALNRNWIALATSLGDTRQQALNASAEKGVWPGEDFPAAAIFYRAPISFVNSLMEVACRFAAISRSSSMDDGPNRANRFSAVSASSPHFF